MIPERMWLASSEVFSSLAVAVWRVDRKLSPPRGRESVMMSDSAHRRDKAQCQSSPWCQRHGKWQVRVFQYAKYFLDRADGRFDESGLYGKSILDHGCPSGNESVRLRRAAARLCLQRFGRTQVCSCGILELVVTLCEISVSSWGGRRLQRKDDEKAIIVGIR